MRVLPVLVMVALLAGCGSLSEDDYIAHVTRSAEAAQAAMNGATRDSYRLETKSKALGRVAEDLGGLEPPRRFKHVNQQLVDGMHELAATFHAAAVAARTGNFRRREAILTHIDTTRGLRDLNGAVKEFDRLAR
jgi:hypothetical protein